MMPPPQQRHLMMHPSLAGPAPPRSHQVIHPSPVILVARHGYYDGFAHPCHAADTMSRGTHKLQVVICALQDL